MTMFPLDAIEAVLFDKDGTLIDYHRSWEPTNRRAAKLAARGDEALERRLLQLGGTDPETGVTRAGSLLAAGNTSEIADAFIAAGSLFEPGDLVARLDALFIAAADDAVPVTDLAALFAALAGRGLAIGIASSDSEAAIRRLLHLTGAEPFVGFVAGYDSGHGAKPGPGMLIGFSRSIGVAPERIAVVGDNLHDMEMGRAGGAGLRIGVLTGTSTAEDLMPTADLCLPSVVELAERLAGRSAA
ncbi:HAD family hydrolase [Aureimonas sp. ME7]|uniref:HAD family hydrolase n=1 Tax=Aureimonas sp. ME7 TaxID=2744252 RepID=UPI0015F53FE5|nr:HAD family hydrolase [Aureimonas sp. ME7]